MPFNGAGVFNRLFDWENDAAAGIDIMADRMDAEFDGIAGGLSICLTRDGQSIMQANLDMAGFKIIRLGAPTLDTDAVNKGYLVTNYTPIGSGGINQGGDDITFVDDFNLNRKSGWYKWTVAGSLHFPPIAAGGGPAMFFPRSGDGVTTTVGAWLAFSSGTSGNYPPQAWMKVTSATSVDFGNWDKIVTEHGVPILRNNPLGTLGNFMVWPTSSDDVGGASGDRSTTTLEWTDNFLPPSVHWTSTAANGVRGRFSGSGGTGGLFQLSSADGNLITMQPSSGHLDFNGGGNTGFVFAQGIKIRSNGASKDGNVIGHVSFVNANGTGAGNVSIDFSILEGTSGDLYTYRFGRFSAGNVTSQILLVVPGATTAVVRIRAPDGLVSTTGWFEAGPSNKMRVGARADGSLDDQYFSSSGTTGALQTGNASTSAQWNFRSGDSTLLAQLGPEGSVFNQSYMLATRIKGDSRWTITSSQRFKTGIVDQMVNPLIAAFDAFKIKTWKWGGDVSEDNEKFGTIGIGLVAEDVLAVLPQAVTFQWKPVPGPLHEKEETPKETEKQILGLDPIAIIAVLVAKIRQLEARLDAL